MSIAISQFIPLPSFPLGNHKLIYNVMLITVIKQRDSVVYISIFTFFLKIYKYTFHYGLSFFFFFCARSSLLHRLFSSCRKWGLFFVAMHELLVAMTSIVAEHSSRACSLPSCDTWTH